MQRQPFASDSHGPPMLASLHLDYTPLNENSYSAPETSELYLDPLQASSL